MSENEKLVERLLKLALYNGAGALGSMQYGLQEAATALTAAEARIKMLSEALRRAKDDLLDLAGDQHLAPAVERIDAALAHGASNDG